MFVVFCFLLSGAETQRAGWLWVGPGEEEEQKRATGGILQCGGEKERQRKEQPVAAFRRGQRGQHFVLYWLYCIHVSVLVSNAGARCMVGRLSRTESSTRQKLLSRRFLIDPRSDWIDGVASRRPRAGHMTSLDNPMSNERLNKERERERMKSI